MSQVRILVVTLLGVLLSLTLTVSAQDRPLPQVNVGDQLIMSGYVTIDSIYSDTQGFVVIHRTSDGAGVGVSQVLNPGWTYNLQIPIDTTKAEARMSGMLHFDDNTLGLYEFGAKEGADAPVILDGQIVNTLFNAQVLDATDQPLDGNAIRIKAAAVPVDSWVVVHSGDAEKFGGVLGQAFLKAGTSTDILVEMSGNLSSILWPMLHIDNGQAGVYEFNGGEIDAPVVLNGQIATFPIWTINHLRVDDQIAINGDNLPEGAAQAALAINVKSVLSEGPGIVVIHANDNGNAGAILGAAFVDDGLTENINIPLDEKAGLTPVVWPMLHIDAGTIGTYDGLEVDGVAEADGDPVTFTINAAPALTVEDTKLIVSGDKTLLTVKRALIDAPGFIAIHTDNNGQPGPVIGTALLHTGVNANVQVAVDPAQAGTKVFPMLHYDTNVAGKYEFGDVEGADAPVFVQEQVIFLPQNVEAADAVIATTPDPGAGGCIVTARNTNVNIRSGAGTNFDVQSVLNAGSSAEVNGQTIGSEGLTWYQLSAGGFIRSDVVSESAGCANLPNV
jgi:hypothetical protein